MACSAFVNSLPVVLFTSVSILSTPEGDGDDVKNAFVCNTGSAIWALDWLVDSSILAVGGFKNRGLNQPLTNLIRRASCSWRA
jgi:hypothetical protein